MELEKEIQTQGVVVPEEGKGGISQYFGQYASKEWWRTLLKYVIEVGVSKLLIAFAESFAGTLVWHVKEKSKNLPNIDPVAKTNTAATGVFSGGYNHPTHTQPSQTQYSSPARSNGYNSNNNPTYGQNDPFSGFNR